MEVHEMIIDELRQQAKLHAKLFHQEPTVTYYEGNMSASNQALRKAVSIVEYYYKEDNDAS
jgi:hypothetical protein